MLSNCYKVPPKLKALRHKSFIHCSRARQNTVLNFLKRRYFLGEVLKKPESWISKNLISVFLSRLKQLKASSELTLGLLPPGDSFCPTTL